MQITRIRIARLEHPLDPPLERIPRWRHAMRRQQHRRVVVARRLNEQLAGQTVYTDGWANDYTWLSAL